MNIYIQIASAFSLIMFHYCYIYYIIRYALLVESGSRDKIQEITVIKVMGIIFSIESYTTDE